MALTNYPSGISSFGVPVIGSGSLPIGPNYFFVNSVTGNAGNTGSYDSPMATIGQAVALCTAAQGDTVVVMEGHAETISGAAGLNVNKSGIFILGQGTGNNRPVLTFATSTAATCTITAANVTMSNIVATTTVDQIVSPFVISAAGVTLSLEWQDGSSVLEAVRAVLTTAAADNLTLNLRYIGFPAGSHGVNAVRLVGCNDATLNLNVYGKFSTSVVEFATTACTDVNVFGYMYNSGTTNGTKNIVDTITGSTWWAAFQDGSAGASFSGGSGAALSSDDISTVAANQTVPTTDSTANVLERDVIGNKADTALYTPSATASNQAYTKGIADLQEKTTASATAVMVNGNTIFTVAGGPINILSLVSLCITTNGATASTLQYSVTPTVGAGAATISGASASLANAAAGASVTLAGTALATAALLSANGPNLMANPGTIFCPAGIITLVIGTGSTTGTWKHYIRYKPLDHGVTVV